MKHRKSDPMGALRTALFMFGVQGYIEQKKREKADPRYAEREAARMERMQNGRFWKTAVIALVIIFILVILFT